MKTEKAGRRGHCGEGPFVEKYNSPTMIPWEGARRINTLISLSSPFYLLLELPIG